MTSPRKIESLFVIGITARHWMWATGQDSQLFIEMASLLIGIAPNAAMTFMLDILMIGGISREFCSLSTWDGSVEPARVCINDSRNMPKPK